MENDKYLSVFKIKTDVPTNFMCVRLKMFPETCQLGISLDLRTAKI